jgi:hypothetical protein
MLVSGAARKVLRDVGEPTYEVGRLWYLRTIPKLDVLLQGLGKTNERLSAPHANSLEVLCFPSQVESISCSFPSPPSKAESVFA